MLPALCYSITPCPAAITGSGFNVYRTTFARLRLLDLQCSPALHLISVALRYHPRTNCPLSTAKTCPTTPVGTYPLMARVSVEVSNKYTLCVPLPPTLACPCFSPHPHLLSVSFVPLGRSTSSFTSTIHTGLSFQYKMQEP